MKNARSIAAIAGAAAILGSGSVTIADTTISIGNLLVDTSTAAIDLNGAAIAAGTYTGWTLTTDWSAGIGGPWSSEAVAALLDGAFPGTITYGAPTVANNAADDGNAVTLNFGGSFQQQSVESGLTGTNYMGGDDLFLNVVQSFAGSNANWDNTSLVLSDAPVSFDETFCGGFASGTTATGNSWDRTIAGSTVISGLGPVEYAAVTFFVDTTGNYDIASITPDHDGYLHIYEGSFDPNDQLTNLVGADDDGAELITGSSVVEDITLTAGTTYIAVVSGFELGEAGAFTLNSLGDGKAFIPAPSAVALLGLGGLAATRRRR